MLQCGIRGVGAQLLNYEKGFRDAVGGGVSDGQEVELQRKEHIKICGYLLSDHKVLHKAGIHQ